MQCDGIYGGDVYTLAVSGKNLFAGTFRGVFLSTNNGLTWAQTSLNDVSVSCIATCGSNVFVGTYPNHGIFFSTNNGIS